MAKKPPESQNDELNQMVPAGLRWLYEMEAVNSPVLLNNLYGNLYSFPHVSDCEILLDRYRHKMLIYVKFTWLTRKFLKRRRKALIMAMLDQLQELLPSFEFRIIEDRALFNRAVKRMEEVLFGVKVDQNPNAGDAPAAANGDPNPIESKSGDSGEKPVEGAPQATQADPKKPSGT